MNQTPEPILNPDRRYTIEAAIRAAANAFDEQHLYFGHGTASAIDEASWLILEAMKLSPLLTPDYQKELAADEIQACNRILQQRIDTRQPAAYLTGRAWFAGHEFLSDQRALVPRSPLAELINQDFFGLLDHCGRPSMLDLCTGGGCIAIACAYACPDARVDASDLSADALSLAQENLALHDMTGRIRLFQGNLFEAIDDRYDLILSNPPYVDAEDIRSMPDEYRHEPLLGLAAGQDGLDLVRPMLHEAARYLNEGGALVVEVGNSQPALEQAYPELNFQWLEFSQGGAGVFVLHKHQLCGIKHG